MYLSEIKLVSFYKISVSSKKMQTEKEKKLLDIVKGSDGQYNITQLSKLLNTSLPYTSQMVSMLEAKSLVRIEQRDKRSKKVIFTPKVETSTKMKIEYQPDPISKNLALKLVSFFLTHSDQMRAPLRTKLLDSFTEKDREFITQNSSRIEELELTWEES